MFKFTRSIEPGSATAVEKFRIARLGLARAIRRRNAIRLSTDGGRIAYNHGASTSRSTRHAHTVLRSAAPFCRRQHMVFGCEQTLPRRAHLTLLLVAARAATPRRDNAPSRAFATSVAMALSYRRCDQDQRSQPCNYRHRSSPGPGIRSGPTGDLATTKRHALSRAIKRCHRLSRRRIAPRLARSFRFQPCPRAMC